MSIWWWWYRSQTDMDVLFIAHSMPSHISPHPYSCLSNLISGLDVHLRIGIGWVSVATARSTARFPLAAPPRPAPAYHSVTLRIRNTLYVTTPYSLIQWHIQAHVNIHYHRIQECPQIYGNMWSKAISQFEYDFEISGSKQITVPENARNYHSYFPLDYLRRTWTVVVIVPILLRITIGRLIRHS